ncbi:Protein CBR-PAT-12 [Caenorhabditis briggsae]|uniref:Protein CBR-PAT-12 n=1 Tax=Caenorhabditis briggsae TaxID=6238 RepID=A8XLL7_CAEBR|nr:Protein CBR-PAT-12 [Caenorhabditis briggsae]CAP33521.1 Protein CBR-PAT-12 [Caenorhabditis briggsae]
MTSQIQAEISTKRWSIPEKVTEEGQKPGPEDHPSTKQGREQEGRVIGITPNYKIGEGQPKSELNLGKTGYLPNGHGDYKMTSLQETYKQTLIDPKVISNANMPYLSTRIPDARRNVAGDFPSEHSKRSQIKLEPLEQRRFRSTESRPISTSNYLTESVERHRDMEASRLKEYLKAKESDANQPWNKPGWPGPKKNDENNRELETLKQVCRYKKEDKNFTPNAELDEISKRAEELRKRDGRSKYKLVESDIYKTDPDPMPSNLKDQVRELLESRNSVETTTTQRDQDKSGYVTDVSTATWNFSTLDYSPRSVVSMNGARYDILKTVPPLRTKTPPPPPPPVRRHEIYEQHERYTSAPNLQSAVIRIQDDKPRSIMKRRELESREQLLFPTVDTQVVKSVVRKPTVTETVQRFEETRRTEEVERRVQRREKKERRSRHHSSSRHQSGWEGHTGGYQGHRSSSLSRGGYLPGGQETYYRQETTRRQQHNNYDDNFNRGIAHARYGSLSDSLRRGELQYVPNGEVRQSFYRDGGASGGQRMHKSYSTRDVFTGDAHDDRRSVSSFHRRGSQQQVSPFVEFPPTLPRRGAGGDYRREEDAYFRPVSKSRSYADWDDAGRAGMGREVRRYDDDMSRLEAEFRDSLLMPMPNGNMNERDHRTEQLPGGYETFNKDRHANSGRRTGRDGKPVDFSEASQEYNYKREQTLNDDRRRR